MLINTFLLGLNFRKKTVYVNLAVNVASSLQHLNVSEVELMSINDGRVKRWKHQGSSNCIMLSVKTF